MPEPLEPEMSVDEAIKIINQYLAKNGAKDSQGRAMRINKDEPDWERGLSLINLASNYKEPLLNDNKFDEYGKLSDSCDKMFDYFIEIGQKAKQQASLPIVSEAKTPPPLVFSTQKKRAITEDDNVRAPDHKHQRVEDKTKNVAPLTPPKTNRLKPPSA